MFLLVSGRHVGAHLDGHQHETMKLLTVQSRLQPQDYNKENNHLLQQDASTSKTSNTTLPHQTTTRLDVAPPYWLKTTIEHVFSLARIVLSLQLATTEDYILTPYTCTFKGRSRIFLHTAFFARHYSLPPRQPSVFARLARRQLFAKGEVNISEYLSR